MARRAWWPTVETSEATIFARGNLTPAACALALANCCGEAGGATTTVCCPDGFDSTIFFAAFGPLGAGFGLELIEYELNWSDDRRSWIGGAEGAAGEAVVLELWCEEDDELGQVWWLAGSYFAVALGVRIPFTIPGIVPTNGLIVADIEVPGSATPLTVVITHPCSEATPDGGAGSGGTDPGGSATACGCTNISDTLYVVFYGALASYGTLALTRLGMSSSWLVTPPGGPCNAGNSPISFTCVSGTTWGLSTPGHGGAVSTTFSGTATAISCSPLVVNFSGTATGTCGSYWSAVVSEYDPSGLPPAGPPTPEQASYCLTSPVLTPGLTLAPKTDSSWWSDNAGSWILIRTSETGWRLLNPRGDVFFVDAAWDGTGSATFGGGIYTLGAGACS